MAVPAALLLSALRGDYDYDEDRGCAGAERPLTAEPAMGEDTPLTSEPPLAAGPPLTSEPTVGGVGAGAMEI